MKPCPFCGGDNIRLIHLRRWFFSCDTCSADGPETTETEQSATHNGLKHEATQLWERRAPAKIVDEFTMFNRDESPFILPSDQQQHP